MARKGPILDTRVQEGTDTVPYAPDVDLLIGPGFSSEERGVIDHKLAAHKEDVARKKRLYARYTVEVVFGTGYSTQKPSGGMIVYWENGALDGDGQGSVYLCPGECGRPLPAGGIGGEEVFCPNCNRVWPTAKTDGGRYVKQGVQGWADAILIVVQRLGLNADIRLIYSKEDIREAAHAEQEHSREGELMGDVRRGRVVRVYWLHDIVKDTTSGADLRSRILAFLKA